MYALNIVFNSAALPPKRNQPSNMSQCGESCYEVAIVIVKMQLNASAHARYVLDVSVDRVNFKLDFQNVSKELLGDSRGSKEVQGDPL